MTHKIRLLIILNIIYLLILNSLNKCLYNKFVYEINKTFNKVDKVNINKIDEAIFKTPRNINKKIKSTINIGFTLDKNYVLETMLTITSIMATQKKATKIRFHFGVTNNFTADKMIRMYELRKKINNSTEFNFYYLKESVIKMKHFHPKGEACPGKFELPMLLPNDVDRLIIFDAGDLLVLRDLSELYNYNMSDYWVLGNPEPRIIDSFMKVKYNLTKYINIGAILLDIKKFRENNFWLYFIKNKRKKLVGQPDQTLFNILIPDDKKNYFPFKYGGYSILSSDKNYDKLKFEDFRFKKWLKSNISNTLPEKPNSEKGILLNLYNPRFIHQFSGKWEKGEGLTIYRLLAKYFIGLAGITVEICKKKPGYCK